MTNLNTYHELTAETTAHLTSINGSGEKAGAVISLKTDASCIYKDLVEENIIHNESDLKLNPHTNKIFKKMKNNLLKSTPLAYYRILLEVTKNSFCNSIITRKPKRVYRVGIKLNYKTMSDNQEKQNSNSAARKCESLLDEIMNSFEGTADNSTEQNSQFESNDSNKPGSMPVGREDPGFNREHRRNKQGKSGSVRNRHDPKSNGHNRSPEKGNAAFKHNRF